MTGETLQVTHAAALPFPGLNADACALGARGMGRAADARTDWVGCWLCAPNGRSPTLASTLTRSDASQRTAIFAAQRVSLTAGVENGRLTFTALRALDIDLSPESLPTAQTL